MITNSITIRWPAGLHLEDVFIPTLEQYARFSYYAALLEEQARDIVRDKMSRHSFQGDGNRKANRRSYGYP